MEESMLEYVLRRLDESKGKLPIIAAASGVPYRTLQKISLREVSDPGVSKVQRLYDYFKSEVAA